MPIFSKHESTNLPFTVARVTNNVRAHHHATQPTHPIPPPLLSRCSLSRTMLPRSGLRKRSYQRPHTSDQYKNNAANIPAKMPSTPALAQAPLRERKSNDSPATAQSAKKSSIHSACQPRASTPKFTNASDTITYLPRRSLHQSMISTLLQPTPLQSKLVWAKSKYSPAKTSSARARSICYGISLGCALPNNIF